MKNNILTRLLLSAVTVLTVFSCGEDSSPKSLITSFEKYSVTASTGAVTVDEAVIDDDADTVNFVFTINDKQRNDISLEISVTAASTATEGADFDLLTHEVDLLAYQGQDGFVVPIVVYEDYEPEDGDEDIFLTFTSVDPSGLVVSETKVVTIKDSGLEPVPAETADFEMSWAFALAENGEDPCDIDIDLCIQSIGSSAYANDLLDNEAAGSTCVEGGHVVLEDMVDGETYAINVYIYGNIDYGDLSPVTVTIAFARENTTFEGELVIEDVFDSRDNNVRVIVGSLVRNGDTLTLLDADDNVVGEGRMRPKYTKISGVTKP